MERFIYIALPHQNTSPGSQQQPSQPRPLCISHAPFESPHSWRLSFLFLFLSSLQTLLVLVVYNFVEVYQDFFFFFKRRPCFIAQAGLTYPCQSGCALAWEVISAFLPDNSVLGVISPLLALFFISSLLMFPLCLPKLLTGLQLSSEYGPESVVLKIHVQPGIGKGHLIFNRCCLGHLFN